MRSSDVGKAVDTAQSNESALATRRQVVPLRERPVDVAIFIFFCINILFITYLIDLEQLVSTSAAAPPQAACLLGATDRPGRALHGADAHAFSAVADPSNFEYPWWPPAVVVDVTHWYGRTFDPVLIARPLWWRVTIWWDALFFGPFYCVALRKFWRGDESSASPASCPCVCRV